MKSSIMFPGQIPANPHGCPVDDLEEGDNAEAKKEAKESAKGRDKLNRSHRDSSLQLFHEEKKGNKFIARKFSPITVSCPKKMLRVAKSSSHALYVVGPPWMVVEPFFFS